MFTVYILKSLKDDKRYIGFTSNLTRRISEHNSGLVKSTRNRKSFKLIYTEEYTDREKAMKREAFFKTSKGRGYLKEMNIF